MWLDRDPADPARYRPGNVAAEPNRERAIRRAKTTTRRFIKGHQLGTIITLTYADQHDDRRRVYEDMARFERGWNERYPTRPWVWVIERHKSGNFHVHWMTIGRYAVRERRERALAALWGHGFVDAGKSGSPAKAASYAAKYMAKDMATTGPGDHSYETRQGFRIEPLEAVFETLGEAVDALIAFYGSGPSFLWSSSGLESYRGPPTWLFMFDRVAGAPA